MALVRAYRPGPVAAVRRLLRPGVPVGTVRPPITADPDEVPPPTVREMRRRAWGRTVEAMLLIALMSASWTWAGGVLSHRRWGSDLTFQLARTALAALAMGMLARQFRGAWIGVSGLRALARRTAHGEPVPRVSVVVVGFVGAGTTDVAVEPAPPPGPVERRPRLVVVQELGRKLRHLALGDVLVCDGHLAPGDVVRLAGAWGTAWSRGIRVTGEDEVSRVWPPVDDPHPAGTVGGVPHTGPVTAADVSIRPAGPGDRDAIVAALVHAVNWSPDRQALPVEEVLARPHLAHYVDGWPRPGDRGVLAVLPTGEAVGAAWLRHLPADDPGYGFVADGVPELSIGVRPDARGRGIGRMLLRALFEAARADGVRRISLSVERANRARELYLAEGFTVVGGDAGSDTMLLTVSQGGILAC